VIARREVGLRSYPFGPATTKGLFDRRSGPACTVIASSEDTDRPDRSRRAESLRPTSGTEYVGALNGRCRPARPLRIGGWTASAAAIR